MSLHFPLPKNSHNWRSVYTFPCQNFTLPISPFLNGNDISPSLFRLSQWGLSIKMATGCESQRWGTLADPWPGRGHGDEWIDCVGSMRASPHPVDGYLLLSKSVPVIPRYGHQMCSVFCGRRGLKNGQKPLKDIFLPSLACRDRSQLNDLDRGSGHRSCTCTVNPKNFFLLLLCQPFYISRVSLFLFFLLYSSVAQTLKNVGPLDCKLRLFRRRSLGGKISVAKVMHLLTLNVFSANFRAVLVVAFFYFLFFFFYS